MNDSSKKMKQNPTLSVCMITYGHENFIRQAIEGVLMQQCDFEIELIIANDCSPDNTDTVVKNIIENHSNGNCIQYTKHEINLGMMPNFIFAIQKCKGKYVALCEGDDYWTDPLKLQKQVGFLEQNPDFAITFHGVKLLRNDVFEFDSITPRVNESTTIEDLAKGNFMHTCSVVYRNNLFPEFPEYFKVAPAGDYFLHLLNARYGKIKFLADTMGIYRIHDSSLWSFKSRNEQIQIWIPFLVNIKSNFSLNIQKILDKQIQTLKSEKKSWSSFFRKLAKKLAKKLQIKALSI